MDAPVPAVMLKPFVDSTMITAFRQCPRKFFHEFVQGYRVPGKSIDLHAGGCFAGALEEVYIQVHLNKRTLEEALWIAHAKFTLQWGDFVIPEHKKTSKTFDRVWVAVAGGDTSDDRGYFQEYPPLTDHVQPYFKPDGSPTAELSFAIPLDHAVPFEKYGNARNHDFFPLHPSGEPFMYSGKIDLMGKYLGRPIWRDEKTSKNNPRSNRNWSEQWDLRSQFIGYTWACQQLGLDCEGGCVRGVGILKEGIHHAEALKTYSKTVIDRWYEILRRDLWKIMACHEEGYWDFDYADACTSYGNCVFMEVCQSTTPESWLNRFEVRHWNPADKDPDA